MSGITLSAGVRQNLLSLQNTASLLTTTQNDLATGKKVNSAFDNPTSYFTSQSLNNRANSLNALLDQIGQATQTLQTANQGLTSLTSLLQQALSTAQQALQAPAPSTLSYGAITTNGSLKTAETTGTVTGTNALGATLGASSDVLSITTGGSTFNVTLAATDTVAAVVNAINNTSGLGSTGAVTASTNSSGHLVLTANSTATSFTANDTNGESGLTTTNIASVTGASALGTTLGPANDTLAISVAGGSTYNITLNATDTVAAVVNQINNTTGLGSSGSVTASTNSSGKLVLTANSSSISFTATDTTGETGLDAVTYGVATGGTAYGPSGGTLAAADTLSITAGGSTYNITLSAAESISAAVTQINTTTGLGAAGAVTASTNASGHLVITSNNASSNVVVSDNNSGDAGFATPVTGTSTNVSVTGTSASVTATGSSTDLFQILSAGGITAGDSLTFAVSGGATQQIQFGTSTGQVQTLAQLQSALQGLSGISAATASGSAVSINVASSNALNSLTTGSSGTPGATEILNELGLTAGSVSGTAVASGNNSTRTTLQGNYNALLTQIDQLAQDSSYNGVNLLNGDNLQVIFNESNTSSLTIGGVTDNSAGLGLSQISGTGFQDDNTINSAVASIQSALSNVQAQTETFGTNASTIQIRQSFTQNLVNVLQTGADNLVLADQNQESANLLTLQTQQQLEISALSIANQANQSVLKLFG